ncbi:MAG TPA: DUF4198 domain-containing protein [Candidatus Solibacter sp.]|nr:DUF4198 domain-containing protein [Candidatus Solibacter sp.]
MTCLLTTLLVAFAAHDFWIEPSSFAPQPGQIVSVRLRVGQELIGDPVPRDPALVNQFVFEDAAGRRPLIGRDGSDPAGYLRVEKQGLVVIGYASNPSTVDMPAEKFNQYLKDEGLDAAAELRTKRNQNGAHARELFSRCAKSLTLSGTATSAQTDRRLGFTLELVAERNPYALRTGEELPVRLTYQGRALAGALVVAMNKMDPMDKLSARSDAEGRVRFRLPQFGMWMIKAVHMIPAPAGANADWSSYWASLTFEYRR